MKANLKKQALTMLSGLILGNSRSDRSAFVRKVIRIKLAILSLFILTPLVARAAGPIKFRYYEADGLTWPELLMVRDLLYAAEIYGKTSLPGYRVISYMKDGNVVIIPEVKAQLEAENKDGWFTSEMEWLKPHNLYRIFTSGGCELGKQKPGACVVIENKRAYMIGVSINSSGVRQLGIGQLIKDSETAELLDDSDGHKTTVYSMEPGGFPALLGH